jgi:hypothetical protein
LRALGINEQRQVAGDGGLDGGGGLVAAAAAQDLLSSIQE